MENVHILTQRIAARGDYLPFSAEHYRVDSKPDIHQLVETLQTTLELNRLIEIFAAYALKRFKFSGLQFQSSLGVVEMAGSVNKSTPHSFDIEIENEHLGQLIYFSEYPFTPSVREALCRLHSVLAYPLRNALLYNRVLKLATKDALTGLNNRSDFNETLEQRLERCRRQHSNFSLMLLDLDNFKQVNDSQGHKVGDKVLTEFAAILQASIRGTDSVYRFGGDEFAIIVDDHHYLANKVIAKRVLNSVASNAVMGSLGVTTSIGFALATSRDSLDSLFERADRALYRAKNEGRNRYCAGDE